VKRCFDQDAWADYVYWQETDAKVLRKINELIKDCVRSPFKGLGKPEPLKGEYSGWWSRRIDDEHRMVYRVTGSGDAQSLEILQLRFHYSK
jgi:toxin YoeB